MSLTSKEFNIKLLEGILESSIKESIIELIEGSNTKSDILVEIREVYAIDITL